jgi:hypothetical protein
MGASAPCEETGIEGFDSPSWLGGNVKTFVIAAAVLLLLIAGCPQELMEERGVEAPGGSPQESASQEEPAAQAEEGNGGETGELEGDFVSSETEECLEYENYVVGKLHGVQGTYENACMDTNYLKYYSCKYGEVAEKNLRCGWGCKNLKCQHNVENALCVESSETNDPYERGITKMVSGTTTMETVEDRCADPETLYEYSCYQGDIRKEVVDCKCREGECVVG